MDWILDLLRGIWASLLDENHRGRLKVVGASLAACALGLWAVFTYFDDADKIDDPAPRAEVSITLEQYEAMMERRPQELRAKLAATKDQLGAESEKRRALEAALAAAETRLADIEGSFENTKQALSEVEAELAALSTVASDKRFEAARAALAAGDAIEAESLLEVVVADSEEQAAKAAHLLGRLAGERLDYFAAMAAYRRAVQLAPDNSIYLMEAGGMARTIASEGEARPLYERALAIREAAFGPDHPYVAAVLNDLAVLHQTEGRYDEARPLLERALAIDEAAFGPDHPSVATALINLGAVHANEGRTAEAWALYTRAIAIFQAAFGPDHPYVATALGHLGLLHQTEGRAAVARFLFEHALAIEEAASGPDDPNIATVLNDLAVLHQTEGRYDEARPLFERALAIHEAALGPDHPDTVTFRRNYENLLRAMEDPL